MLLDMIGRHLVTVFMALIFVIVLWPRKSFRNTKTKYFWITVLSCLLLVWEDVFETIAAGDPGLWFFRTLLSVIGYTCRSAAALGLLLVVAPQKKKILWLCTPCLVTFLVSCTAFFTGIAFCFDEDYAFHRGPLGYVAFVVPVLYLIMILWIVFRRFSEKNGFEKYIAPLCVIFCMAASAADAISGGVRLNEAIMGSSVFFYIVLYSYDNRRDPLTGLLNRQSFYDDCSAYGKNVGAVASIDMNGLKRLNDTNGHQAGDEALAKIGGILAAAADRETLAYRIGGDEFVIMFLHGDPEKIGRVKESIKSGVVKEGYSVSVGCALRADGDALEDVIKNSDKLMYEDKAKHYSETEFDRRRKRDGAAKASS